MMERIIVKFRELSKPAKASLIFTICSFIQKGISFCVVPIYTRIMDQGQYGYYTTFISWMSIIATIATLNLSYHVYINGMMKYRDRRDEYTSSMLGLSAIITSMVFAIYFIGRDFFNNILEFSTIYMVAMFVEILLQPSFEFWAASERIKYSYKQLSILTVSLAILVPLISIPVILSVSDESKGLAAVLCKVVITCSIYLIPFLIIIKKNKPLFNKEFWGFALKFNLPLIPHFLSVIILQQCDRLMISHICGKTEVAMYSVAFSISTIMTLVNTAILNSFTPWTYQTMEAKAYEKIRNISKSICLLIAVINLFVVFIAPDIIRIIAPSNYLDGVYVVVPLIVSVYFMFCVNLFVNIEYFYAKVKYVTLGSVGAVLINILLNSIFIPKCGFIAAGYTTLTSYVIYCVGHFVISSIILKEKGIKAKFVYNSKLIFGVGLAFLIISIMCSLTYQNAIIRYALMVLSFIISFFFKDKIMETIKAIKK